MKTELEQHDIEAIALRVTELIKPLLSNNDRSEAEDTIFDKKGLAEYLKLSMSTIDKLVGNKQIPYFKINSGQSGGVRFSKRNIGKWITRHAIPEINIFNRAINNR